MVDRLRADARACFERAIAAVEPEALVRDFLAAEPGLLPAAAPVRLVAVGKAGLAMARGAAAALPGRISSGVLVVPAAADAVAPEGLEVHHGGHPVPNESGVAGAEAVRRLAAGAGEGDVLLCLISGGGSALMTLPVESVDLGDVRETTHLLLESGATIDELNTVRKHLDRLKGGCLARVAAPARVVTLILSDVVGDPLDVIASGPTVPDRSTFGDAVGVLRDRELWERVPASVREYLEAGAAGAAEETPRVGDPCFARARTEIVGNNRLAAEAALAEASARGYSGQLLTTTLTGEARDVGAYLAEQVLELRRSAEPEATPGCLVAAGESTVIVRGSGRGGRNQELALAAALRLEGVPGVLLGSVGTDGIDGPTDAAGAVADGETVPRARALGLEPDELLADNDSNRLFAALDDLVVTGPTGTNVMDVQVALVASAEGDGS